MNTNIWSQVKQAHSPVFTQDIRRKLHEYGIVKIRQSSYSDGRLCPTLMVLSKERTMGVNALLGSVYHKASDQIGKNPGLPGTQAYWYDLMIQVIRENPQTTYTDIDGSPVQDHRLVDFALGMATGEPWGLPLMAIVSMCEVHIKSYGLNIIAREKQINWSDPGPYPIEFDGTLDLLAENASRSELGIGDTKTYGLWDKLTGKGSTKSQSFEEGDIYWAPQLQHYDWQSWRKSKYKAKVRFYFMVFPVNVVPYKQKGKQGEMRGDVVVRCAAPTVDFIRAYEYDLRKFYESIALLGPQRLRPHSFGKPVCKNCRVAKVCLEDTDGRRQAEALQSSMFDYLRS